VSPLNVPVTSTSVPESVLLTLRITTKSVYVLGIELKVTVAVFEPSVLVAIGSYVAGIFTP